MAVSQVKPQLHSHRDALARIVLVLVFGFVRDFEYENEDEDEEDAEEDEEDSALWRFSRNF